MSSRNVVSRGRTERVTDAGGSSLNSPQDGKTSGNRVDCFHTRLAEAPSFHVRVSEGPRMWSSRCSRSPGEERISFPLGQMARGELVRRASGPCKIDHESRSIQIKVNTGPLAFSIASARWRLREYSGGGGGG